MDDSRCEVVVGRDRIRGVIHRTPQNDQAVAGRVRLFYIESIFVVCNLTLEVASPSVKT